MKKEREQGTVLFVPMCDFIANEEAGRGLLRLFVFRRCSLIPVPCISSIGGEVANAQVCKTCIRGFDPRPVLQILTAEKGRAHDMGHGLFGFERQLGSQREVGGAQKRASRA